MENERRRIKKVREHFSKESRDFDSIITTRVPFYDLFIEALSNVVPFKKEDAIKVVDLGCGTGTVALRVKERFPRSEITCVDFSPEMLDVARKKLSKYTGISYCESDILQFDFTGYDAVLSSLCLHHIGSEKEKKNFFKKVYKGLSRHGVFYIYDVVLASGGSLQDVYLKEWKRYMEKNLFSEEIEETIRNYENEDRPFPLLQELQWLEEAGFRYVDVVCKFYNGAVYGGVK